MSDNEPLIQNNDNEEPKKLKSWVIALIVLGIGLAVIIALFVTFVLYMKKTVKEMNAVVDVVKGQYAENQKKDAETLQAFAEGQLKALEEKRKQQATLDELNQSISDLEKQKQADLDEAVRNAYKYEGFESRNKYKSALLDKYFKI